jgi:HEPN domain-containing protein/predicted nucleotidyltransferase
MVLAAPRTDPQLDALVASIADRIRLELLLLFGSRARGDAREDSDYDLMLVLPDDADVEADLTAANDAACAMRFAVEFLACTVSEYQRRQHDPGFMQWIVAREGRVLFTRGNVPQYSPRTDRVSEEPSEGLEIWLQRAEGDFQVAMKELGSASPVWAAICFHAHAAIEKLLKALIVAGGSFPPRTHELKELIKIAAPSLRKDRAFIAACAQLQRLYPKSRYVPHPLPTSDEGRRAVKAARAARDRLLKELKT